MTFKVSLSSSPQNGAQRASSSFGRKLNSSQGSSPMNLDDDAEEAPRKPMKRPAAAKKAKRSKTSDALSEQNDASSSEASAEGSAKPKRRKSQKKIGLYNEFKESGIPEPCIPRRASPEFAPASFKAIAWNVGGLRALLNSRAELLAQLVEEEQPDLIGMLETKLQEGDQVDAVSEKLKELLPDYTEMSFYCSKEKKGYSGVCVLLKQPALSINSVKLETGSDEGRILEVEFPDHIVSVIYVPNSGEMLKRLEERTKVWDVALRKRLLGLSKPVLVLGDLNVAHRDCDIWNSEAPHVPKMPGTTPEERESFTELLSSGFVDAFTHLHPEVKGQFSYWSQRTRNRPKNRGLRLDYALVSKSLADRSLSEETLTVAPALVDCFYLPKLCPAGDHCPVGATLALPRSHFPSS